MSPLSHPEIEALLGAYALDAVDDDERAAVADHLTTCPKCRAEVDEHREVAGLLAHSGGAAPDGLWDRIAGTLEDTPPPLRLAPLPPPSPPPTPTDDAGGSTVTPLRPRRSLPARVVASIAAAAVIVIGVLGAQVIRQDRRLDELNVALETRALEQAYTAALQDESSTKAELRSDDGSVVLTAVVLPDGTGFLPADQLPALADDRTYQLWAIVGEEAISMGVLGHRPDLVVFRTDPGATALAVTAERAGGVIASEEQPVVMGRLA